ncbi:SWIM zinc finger family protein [archaeon]|jgi:uncharacterized Zn finger protein|nr:SWIM zinc finger family protein [archaeon]
MRQPNKDDENEISFFVQGSSEDPYMVIFVKRNNDNLSAYCSCPAGENGIYCKHRFNILDGDTENVVSDNLDEVQKIQEWYSNSDIKKARDEVLKINREIQKMKRALAKAKKEVAKAMLD